MVKLDDNSDDSARATIDALASNAGPSTSAPTATSAV
jgi:hypothetical protein